MKTSICLNAGLLGTILAAVFGGWDSALTTLVVFMSIDYISGLLVAGVFHASQKSDNGALESRAGWKGLCRKGMTLLIVLIAYRLDIAIGVSYVQNAVVVAFIANEAISIVENAGLMGVPMPAALTKAIDILTSKKEETDDGDSE